MIHSRWVLTAAHCLLDYCQTNPNRMRPYDLVVRLGKWRKTNHFRDPYEIVRGVSQVVCHGSQCRSDRTQPRLNPERNHRMYKNKKIAISDRKTKFKI